MKTIYLWWTMVLEKLAGLLFVASGLFLIVYFPETEDLEYMPFNWVAIIIGLFLVAVGARLVLG